MLIFILIQIVKLFKMQNFANQIKKYNEDTFKELLIGFNQVLKKLQLTMN